MRISVEDAQRLRGEEQYQAYGALDAAGTLEIFNVLHARLDKETRRVYDWSRAQQSPAVEMTIRGVRVDNIEKERVLKQLQVELAEAIEESRRHPDVIEKWDGTEIVTGFCEVPRAVKLTKKGLPSKAKGANRTDPQRHKWSDAEDERDRVCERCGCARFMPKAFEPTSSAQVARLLYERLEAPIQRNKDGGITADDDALASIARKKPKLAAIIKTIQTTRDLQKQAGFLNTRLTPSYRFPSSFNVGGAWTGRWSSSKNPFMEGGNLQNITERHRYIFKPDPGYRMFYADLKTAESLLVAYMSGDPGYIEAHQGDVHTYVCRLVWPELPWTGDIKEDKKIATSHYPQWDNVEGHDYRYQSKAVQHGSNYGLTPFGMAIMRHIPVKAASHAQRQYFQAFPGIVEWQKWTRARIEAGLYLHNPLGRAVRLFGRPWDEHTFKQGYAFGPQSSVGDVLDAALWQLWSRYDNAESQLIQCLAQVHDAVLGQYPIEREAEALRAIQSAMEIPFAVTDIYGVQRVCMIPVECCIGDNWGKASATNPRGLREVA